MPNDQSSSAVSLEVQQATRIEELEGALRVISKIAEDQYPVSIGNQWAWGEVHREACAALGEEQQS